LNLKAEINDDPIMPLPATARMDAHIGDEAHRRPD